MTIKDFTVTSEYDGLSLRLTAVEADETLGVVLLNHGMAEHRKRYLPFIEYLAKNGFTCIINDHRGHGKSVASSEDLGYFDADALLSDMKQINSLAREMYADKPIYLFGHSMGSLAVRAYTRLYDDTINGLIVCGSPSENAAAGIAKGLCKLIAKFKGDRHRSDLLYSLSLGAYEKRFINEGKLAWLCAKKEVQNSYEEDRLCGFKFTVRGYNALFTLMQDAYAKKGWAIKNKLLPVLFIAGSEDPCIVNRKQFLSAVDFMREKYPNTINKLYSGQRHEILNSDIKEQVYEDVLNTLMNWLKVK